MRDRLRDAGVAGEVVDYEGLEHQLDDGTARADMMRRSEAFLSRTLKIQ